MRVTLTGAGVYAGEDFTLAQGEVQEITDEQWESIPDAVRDLIDVDSADLTDRVLDGLT